MISAKQLEANRRNALHSTGPKTTEGKSRSSRNNLRHGLTVPSPPSCPAKIAKPTIPSATN